jgi:4-diphosphocytidyl-2-C-methyl-D-erythritol kinase
LGAGVAPVGATARAKVNLYLHVVGRRADGYHLLDSLVVFADVGDRLTAVPAAGLTLAIDGPFADGLGDGPDNLVMRAALALRAALGGDTPGASLRLTKNLPVAAGLGGGSADAAAALRLLSRLWNRQLPAGRLEALALSLGADLPVCLAGGPRLVGGIGEAMAPPPALPPAWLVLVNPRQPVATAAVFRERQGPFSTAGAWKEAPADAAALAAALADRGNDLAVPACRLAPVIGEVLDELSALPGCLIARVSGSGATCFGLFTDQAAAERAAELLAGRRPPWWIAAAPMLTADCAD